MKRQILKGAIAVLIFVWAPAVITAQGWIKFYNNNLIDPATGNPYRAGIFRDNGDNIPNNSINGAGAGFTAGLFLASDLNTPLATTTFRSTTAKEVFATTQDIQIPGVPAGQQANLVVAVWTTSAGSYLNAKVTPGAEYGEQAFRSKPLGEQGSAVDMAPFQGFEIGAYLIPPGLINANFDSPNLSSGTATNAWPYGWDPSMLYIYGWSIYNAQNVNSGTDIAGIFNASGTSLFKNGAAEGQNVGLIYLNRSDSGEAGLEQNISQFFLQNARRYTLKVEIGNPSSGPINTTNQALDGFPGYRIDFFAQDTLLASDTNSVLVPDGEFRTATVSYISGTNDNSAGKLLKVRLVNLNQNGSKAVAFDNLRLFNEPIQPTVTLSRLGPTSMDLTWTDASETFGLQTASDVHAGAWQDVSIASGNQFGVHHFSVPATNQTTYFRLYNPGLGYIRFYNNNLVNPNTGFAYRAGIFREIFSTTNGNTTIGAGEGYTAGLFLASDLDIPIATTTFRTNANSEVFVSSQTVAIPNSHPGKTVNLVVRAWPTSAGSYRNATATPGFIFGEQAFTSRPLGPVDSPVDMAPFTGFEMIPPL